MSKLETNLDYDLFIADLKSHNLGHYARKIKRSGCSIMVKFQGTIDMRRDEEYSKWCKTNCNEKYFVYNENYVFFQTEEDAVAFKLRWS